jgi:peptidoglycan/LPS O-acetylase OafA/YrhL
MILRSRPLVVLGRWSYAFYLVHATVLHWLARHWMPPRQVPTWDNWLPATVSLIAGLVVAGVLYTLVERPAQTALRGLMTTRRAGRGVGEPSVRRTGLLDPAG